MAMILDGKAIATSMNEALREEAAALRAAGVIPCLAIVRVGERPDDLAYERGAVKRCEAIGVDVRNFVLAEAAPESELLAVIKQINNDSCIHGCLLLQPLPKHMDERAIRKALDPAKDVDGITATSLFSVVAGGGPGFPPCTPKACMEVLDYYNIDVAGKRAVVIGRSLIVGKPAAMMLLQRNATVTICHTKTQNMPALCREADILIVAAGRAGIIGREYLAPNQVVIDVGINVNDQGKLCGDVNFDEAQSLVGALTPVPGGVGAITTSVLVGHVLQAARRERGTPRG